MKQRMRELQKLKGVGEVLSRRFVEAGYDTFAKIAAAGEEGLKKIQGLNPQNDPVDSCPGGRDDRRGTKKQG